MTKPRLRQSDHRAKKLRQAARRQTMAAVFLTVFSMISPAPDLRPKPNLPVKYQMVKPADPPKFGFDAFAASNEAPASAAAAPAADTADALARAGLPPYHPFRSNEAKARYLALYDMRARDWPVPSQTIRVRGAYGETFVRVSGPADAPPLVLLHGISSNSLSWMPNVAALARSHRVVAVDHIQDGGRSIATRSLASLDDHLAWLDGVFDDLGLVKGVNLLGLSYGGWLAAQYALAHPQRLHKLVLVAPPARCCRWLSNGWRGPWPAPFRCAISPGAFCAGCCRIWRSARPRSARTSKTSSPRPGPRCAVSHRMRCCRRRS